ERRVGGVERDLVARAEVGVVGELRGEELVEVLLEEVEALRDGLGRRDHGLGRGRRRRDDGLGRRAHRAPAARGGRPLRGARRGGGARRRRRGRGRGRAAARGEREEALHLVDERLRLEGLRDVAGGAAARRALLVERLEGAGQQQHRDVAQGGIGLDLLADLVAAAAG